MWRIVFLITVPWLTHAGKFERQLLTDILKNYDVLERPVIEEKNPVQLVLGLTLQQIIDVDEKNQVIKLNIWLTYQWYDEHLKWDPTEYNNIQRLQFAPKLIWKPDVLLYNSVDVNFDTTYATNVVVSHDGKVEWLPPGIITSTCPIDITWFPFDEQECNLKYGTWTHNGFLINVSIGTIDTTTYTRNGEWELKDVTASRHSEKYECCPEPYLDITFTIKIKRRTLYYGFNLIIPCLLISLMTLLDFILPPDSGEKLTLGITIFMSLCVFLLMVAETLPPTSDAVPLIGVYFSAIMIIVSASQIFTVLVLNFHHRKPVTHEMSPWISKVFLNWLPWLLLMRRPGYVAVRYKLIRKDLQETKEHMLPLLGGVQTTDTMLEKVKTFREGIYKPSSSFYDSYHASLTEGISQLERVLHGILDELRYITLKIQKEEDEKEIIENWKFAAMALDRFCLAFFTIVMVASTCGIIFAAPSL